MCQSWAPCFTLSTGSMVWVLSNPSISVPFPTVVALRAVSILMNFFTVSSNELWEMKWLRAFLDMILLFILNHLVRSRQQLIIWIFVCSFHSYINHLNSCSPVFSRAYGERVLPNPHFHCSPGSPPFEVWPVCVQDPMNSFTIRPNELQRVGF